jgi:hypothetical protein
MTASTIVQTQPGKLSLSQLTPEEKTMFNFKENETLYSMLVDLFGCLNNSVNLMKNYRRELQKRRNTLFYMMHYPPDAQVFDPRTEAEWKEIMRSLDELLATIKRLVGELLGVNEFHLVISKVKPSDLDDTCSDRDDGEEL